MKLLSAQTKLSAWIANIIPFFDLPNPRIFTLFLISSTATFCLGIAMILEWGLYSQYHPGYHWIVFYAPCVISLPILIWIFCIIFATFYANKDGVLFVESSFNLPSVPRQLQRPVMHHQLSVSEGKKVELEKVDEPPNQLALVPIQPVQDPPPSKSMKEEAAVVKCREDKSTLIRSFSFSFFCNKSTDHTDTKRSMSLG